MTIREEVLSANQRYTAEFGEKGDLPLPPALARRRRWSQLSTMRGIPFRPTGVVVN